MPAPNETPLDWNIVILGAWNIAILTPEGVARRLFQLEPNTPIEVQVATDARAPIRIKHENILVQPSPTSLMIAPQESTPEAIAVAAEIAKRAIQSLPETPLSAAGVNLRYRYESIPEALIDAGTSSVDEKLIDEGYNIQEKTLKRQMPWEGGVINLDLLEQKGASAILLFNYHKNANSPDDFVQWLDKHAAMIENCASLRDVLFGD